MKPRPNVLFSWGARVASNALVIGGALEATVFPKRFFTTGKLGGEVLMAFAFRPRLMLVNALCKGAAMRKDSAL